MLTHSSWSGVGHLACELRPLILRSLLMQEVSLERPDNVFHAVNADGRAIENITVDQSDRAEKFHQSSFQLFGLHVELSFDVSLLFK